MHPASKAHKAKRRGAIFPGLDPKLEKAIYMKWYRFVHDCPENRAKNVANAKQWKINNPDKVEARKHDPIAIAKTRAAGARCRATAKRKAYNAEYFARPEVRERRRQRNLKINGGMDKYYNDIQTRLTCLLRGRLYRLTSRKNFRVSYSMLELLGCTIAELRSHLESQFSSDMSWNNYGAGEGNRWQVDHIIACRRFTLEKTEHQRVCFHWTNLRPLWTEINQSKDSHPSIPKLTDAEVHAMHKKIWGDKIVSITQPNKAEQFPSEQSAQLGNT